MFEYALFLGFFLTDSYLKDLEKIDPKIKQLFISDQGEYLQQVIYEGKLFLGKKVENQISLSELELLEKNIYSILHKLIPDYQYAKTPLLVFVVNLKNSSLN